jgi:hypothetical protein
MSGSRAATRLGWAVLAVLVAGWLALVEVFWLPLRAGTVLLPVSVLAAAVGNPLLVGLAHRLSGSRLVAVLPALTWAVVAFAASTPRAEGDIVLVGGGALGVVGLVFLGLGVVSAAVAVGRVAAGARRGGRAVSPPGSGSGGAR